eukprot:CAMPEP_0113671758 /NCGR_PEP_ID=MMETSP0038_2-20120614/5874_2 /TAXON_ID=2898 /ORGANISM="Cryptomonas paramecium" /LENGTH=256 /DNA_ID=CAMNT_0000587929 /DNA_START=17 /DNA_END=788 /DNA_ORIENTATION=- /assembly_acc=CAM_ASM_000170
MSASAAYSFSIRRCGPSQPCRRAEASAAAAPTNGGHRKEDAVNRKLEELDKTHLCQAPRIRACVAVVFDEDGVHLDARGIDGAENRQLVALDVESPEADAAQRVPVGRIPQHIIQRRALHTGATIFHDRRTRTGPRHSYGSGLVGNALWHQQTAAVIAQTVVVLRVRLYAQPGPSKAHVVEEGVADIYGVVSTAVDVETCPILLRPVLEKVEEHKHVLAVLRSAFVLLPNNPGAPFLPQRVGRAERRYPCHEVCLE